MITNHALRSVISEHSATLDSHLGLLRAGSVAGRWDELLWRLVPCRWLLGCLLHVLLHGLLHVVFLCPDVDLALSYVLLGKDHGALLVLGLSMLLCGVGTYLRDDLMVRSIARMLCLRGTLVRLPHSALTA